MSYENIEKFIKDNNINNRAKLQKLCWKIYREFKKLDKEMQDTLLPTKYSVENLLREDFDKTQRGGSK